MIPTLHAAGKFHRTIATDAAGWLPAKLDFGWEPAVTVAQIQKEIAGGGPLSGESRARQATLRAPLSLRHIR